MMNREKELIKMSRKTRMMKEQILPTVIEHIATIGKRGSWFIEVNKVQYEGRPVQYDIRRWNPDHTHMGKGITLFEHEYEELKEVILKHDAVICPQCGRTFSRFEGVKEYEDRR